jgi:hypothetical protein
MNWLVAFDKNWLTPGLPLIILYSCIEIDQGDPGFCFYSMFPLIWIILHRSIFVATR